MTQPDGKKFRLHLRGDEFFSWHEDADGLAVVHDEQDQFWKFARPAKDRAGFEAIPSARVGSSDPTRFALQKQALPDRNVLRAHIAARQQAVRGPRSTGIAAQSSSSTTTTITTGATTTVITPQGIPVAGTKTIRNIVILASFSDHWNGGTVSSTKGRVSVSEYSNLFNQVGYTTDSAAGSVRDYYNEVSYGKLTVQSIIVPWVQLPQTEAYYGADTTVNDANAPKLAADAIAAAATAGFDFSLGDSDADNWIDCLTIIHSGYGQEYTGNPSTCIWSHKGSMSVVVTKNSKKMYRYHTEPALRGAGGSSITRIGVVCHEMGHFFGLPDLYDYSNLTQGLGNWSLMAGGTWNGTYGTKPAHLDAWSKCFLGFVNPVPVHSLNGLTLTSVEDHSDVKLLRDGMMNGEYFLVENRAKTGFDNSDQIYPGVLIYHVDSKSANNDLGPWPHPVVKLEEADGNDSLGASSPASEAGDVWTSTSGLPGGFRDQTGNQSANAMLYQNGSDYNRTLSAASYSYNTLSSFSAAGSTMTCNLASLKTSVGSQTTNAGNFSVSWPAAAQTTQYELQEGAPVTLTNLADGAEDEDAMYANWYLGGTVTRDTGGARASTYSYAMHQLYNGKWGSSVQTLTLRTPFRVSTNSAISFYLLSHLNAGDGYLKCQISKDGGNTWQTLGTYDGYIDPWSLRSYAYATMNAQGINAGDWCLLRFVANFEYCFGWDTFPGFGFALDDIALTGIELAGYGGWSTLASGITDTTYAVTGKASGTYAYRVRAYANGTWQGYGSEGITTANVPLSVTVASLYGGATPGTLGTNWGATLSQWVTNSPVTGGVGTQYVCVGATVAGNAYTQLSATNLTLTLTNAATVTWLWQTNYWWQVAAGAHGTVAPATGWYGRGSNLLATAAPATYYTVGGWSGQTNGATITSNQLACTMTTPRALQLWFSALLATNSTPQWWLAHYGLTNGGFNAAALDDSDHDGLSNWAEYVAGTDPTNATSVLQVAEISTNSVWFTPALTNRSYAVLYVTNLWSTNWLPLGAYQAGTGTVTALPLTNVASPTIFYRIGVQLP